MKMFCFIGPCSKMSSCVPGVEEQQMVVVPGAGSSCFVRFVGPSGATMVTLSEDGMLRSWDLAMLRGPIWTADVSSACTPSASAGGCPRFAPSSDGSEAALTSPGAMGHIVDLRKDGRVRSAFSQRGAIPAVAWHPSERAVVSGSVDRTVLITQSAAESGRT